MSGEKSVAESRHDPGPATCWKSDLFAAALLVAAVLVVYGRALDAPFIFDDAPNIVENESIRHVWPLWYNGESASGRPVTNLSFAINYHFGKLDPRGYHIVNFLFHSLNVVLLAVLLRRVLRSPYFKGRFTHSAGPLALAIALLWALHPLGTEAVVYVTQRSELMVTFCYLATLYASIRYWESRAFGWLIVAVLACWTGMATKEVMASAPLLVLLFDWTFNAATIRTAWQRSRPLYVGLFGSWLLLAWLAFTGTHPKSAGFYEDVTPVVAWLTQTKVLLLYLKLVVWPWPLAIRYDMPYLTSLGEAWMYVLPVALLVAVVLVLLWHRSSAGYLGMLALAILTPTLIVPIATEIAAERRMYLPLAMLITLFVAGGNAILSRLASETASLAAVFVTAILLAAAGGIVSTHRLDAYADELTIWQDVLAQNPQDAMAQYNAGSILLERHEPAQAADHFRRAIAVHDNYTRAHHNLGAALAAMGKHAEATREFERAAELEPHYALARVKLGITAKNAGRIAEAKRQFHAALQNEPDDAAAHAALADILLNEGVIDDAIRHALAAVNAAPEDAEAHNILGAAFARQGDFAQAIPEFQAAVRFDPKMLQAQGNLMAAYASLGRSDEAIATAEKALALARASDDKVFEQQILTFVRSYRNGATKSP